MNAPTVYGLVLTGGRSRRMQRDKASLSYDGTPQLTRAMQLLKPLVARCFVSVRADQLHDPQRAAYETISDIQSHIGPIGGIHAALQTHPDKAWLILACDLPFLDTATLQHLLAQRAPSRLATTYRSHFDGQPEPLCAIYEPASRAPIEAWLEQRQQCPRAFLNQADVQLLDLPNAHALDNVNTGEEYLAAVKALGSSPVPAVIDSMPASRRLKVRYFALLREQAGRSVEELVTHASTPQQLYQELRASRGLTPAPQFLRVAVNDQFGDWQATLADGDTVVFLPPVAGG